MLGTSIFLNWVARTGADVRPRLAVAARPAGVPHRPHHRRARPLHRHGADLERPRLRRPGGRRHPGRHQRRLPDRRVRRPRLLLPRGPARLARPRPGRARRLDVGASPSPCWSSSASRCWPGTSPAPSASAPRDGVVRRHVPAPDRPGRPVRAAVHHRPALRPAGRHHHQPAPRRRTHRGSAAGLLRPHVGRLHAARPRRSGSTTSARPPCRSPRPGTTSSSPSPWPSASSASPPARRWPVSSGRSSRCPPWSRLVYVSLWARKFYRERTTTPDATSDSTGATR